jgi:hypothetical protein
VVYARVRLGMYAALRCGGGQLRIERAAIDPAAAAPAPPDIGRPDGLRDVAAYLRLSRQALTRAMRAGEGPPLRPPPGRRRGMTISRRALYAWIIDHTDGCEVAAATHPRPARGR